MKPRARVLSLISLLQRLLLRSLGLDNLPNAFQDIILLIFSISWGSSLYKYYSHFGVRRQAQRG